VQEDIRNCKMLASWMSQPPNVGKYGCKEADISHAYRRATEVGGTEAAGYRLELRSILACAGKSGMPT